MASPAEHRPQQEPGQRVPSSGDPAAEPALRDAAAQPGVHRPDAQQKLVVLVGQKKALAMAVKNHRGRRRYTKLAEWLR